MSAEVIKQPGPSSSSLVQTAPMDQDQVLACVQTEIDAAKNYSLEQIGYERA